MSENDEKTDELLSEITEQNLEVIKDMKLDSSASLKESAALFSKSVTKRKLSNTNYVDQVQPGGRWTPAFPAPTKDKETDYIEKMLAREAKKVTEQK